MLSKTNSVKLFCAIGLSFAFNFGGVKSTQANEFESRGFPTGEREGGGVRSGTIDSCDLDSQLPIPLVPQDSETLTAAALPKLFFYVPQSKTVKPLEFIVLDRHNQIVHQQAFPKSNDSQIISLSIPEVKTSDSTADSFYHWYTIQKCGMVSTPKIVANGSFKRVELDSNSSERLKTATELEQFAIYRKANIWHEALNTLVQMQCNNPQISLAKPWSKLMKSADLDNLTLESLNSYCTGELAPEVTLN